MSRCCEAVARHYILITPVVVFSGVFYVGTTFEASGPPFVVLYVVDVDVFVSEFDVVVVL